MSAYGKFRRELEEFLKESGAEPVSPEERTFPRRAAQQRQHPPTKRAAHRIQYHRTWRGEEQTKNDIRAIYFPDSRPTPVRFDDKDLTRTPEPPRRQDPDAKDNFGRAH